jgi:RNA polymerase sigma-70 factor (family 1)
LTKRNDNTSEEYARLILMGEGNTFDFFFRQYYTALCYFANAIIHNEEEAKDIVQDCFVKLWDSSAFIEKVESVPSFLYTSVRNKCIDLLRKRKVIDKARLYSISNADSEFEHFDESAFAEMMRLVLQHVDELPATMQEVIKLYYLHGKKYKEIASALHSSPEAVRKQKARALELIRGKLKMLFFLF